MSNRENGDLQSKYEFNSAWADRIALLIVVGLGIEIVAVFILKRPLLESALAITANVLIAAGVWGELWFARRAKEAGDGIVAEANARASEANRIAEGAKLENTRLQSAMQPRMIIIGNRNGDEKVRAERFKAVKAFSGTKTLIQSVPDFEAQKLAGAIQSALERQGEWNVQVISDIPPGRIDEGVRVFTIEEKLFSQPGPHQLTPDNPLISAAGQAAESLVALLQLDLGPPYGPPLGGVAWSPQIQEVAKAVFRRDIPEDTVLILVGMKPIRWAFAWPVTPTAPTKTEK